MNEAEHCTTLDWDSEFFGFPIGRMHRHALSASSVDAALAWCRDHNVRCLYYLADLEDTEAIHVLEEHGFRLMDIRVCLRWEATSRASAPEKPSAFRIREWQPADLEALQKIARSSYHGTRFYCDSRFDRERCGELYSTWIERSCRGFADAVFVAEDDHGVAGYTTCHLDPEGRGRVGLVGIRSDVVGGGLGGRLVTRQLEWFTANEVTSVEVVTQGRNTRALRLYHRCGFQIQSMHLWYHGWPVDE